MRLQFDPNQEFQIHAIEAVADLLDGQPRIEGGVFELHHEGTTPAVANRVTLSEEELLANLHAVQQRGGITEDATLRWLEGQASIGGNGRDVRFLNYSVEMETGTGKTYVYFRTILELARRYGLRKFCVIVPSVAVREGVLKTYEVTKEHFRSLFDNAVYRCYRYDSKNLSRVRQFAISNSVEIMVMTIDSFNKAANIMVREMDQMQGQTPIHLVQATRPVLILDEPQNLESDKAKAALLSLHPLMALRYSATHRDPYNLVYRLTPYQAYTQGLVKRIQVDAVVKTDDENRPYLRLESVGVRNGRATAKVLLHKLMANGTVKEKAVSVKIGDKLAQKAGRSEYDGFVVDTIDPTQRLVRFAPNDVEMRVGEDIGSDKEAIFRVQIEQTIKRHIAAQKRVSPHGVKVLSLLFIDKVDNYAAADGMIRRLFNEAFDRHKGDWKDWGDLDAEHVQAAYFAAKRRRSGEVELLDSATGESKDDEIAYDLIMRDKETLLSFPSEGDDEETEAKKRVCFIFSHSALREGWDNPNVFQICTLNQSVSNMRKRQEVGRGVRLAVDQTGQRVFDEAVNILTVVANESYEKYVATLQSEIAEEYQSEIEARYGKSLDNLTAEERLEIIEEYGADILPPPPKPADRPKAKLRKRRVACAEFQELWERIKHRTRYAVTIDSDKLLNESMPAINGARIEPPRITVTEGLARISETGGFEGVQTRATRAADVLAAFGPLPDLVGVMAELMERTTPRVRLTRRTMREVLRRTHQKEAIVTNPYEFARVSVAILKEKLLAQLVDGIRYEKDGTWWDMSKLLEDAGAGGLVELFSRYTEKAKNSIYDLIPCDSGVEQHFVKQLEARKDVRVYLKLPPWFKVRTPLGGYNPDWAVVLENPNGGDPLLYLVAETKSTLGELSRRTTENLKILCGAAHFGSRQLNRKGALDGVDYLVAKDASQLGT